MLLAEIPLLANTLVECGFVHGGLLRLPIDGGKIAIGGGEIGIVANPVFAPQHFV